MGLGDLGQLGDIGGMVISTLALFITAIVLITFAPGIAGDIDGLTLSATERCEYQGERFRWLVGPFDAAESDGAAAWSKNDPPTTYKLDKTKCETGAAKASGTTTTMGLTATKYYYTPKGTQIGPITESAAKGAAAQGVGVWKKANRSLTALGGGSIALLLFGAAAILVPAGCIGFLGYFGARFVASNIGGGALAVGIGATIIVVLAGSLLPQIFEPLDVFFLALDGNRYWVFSTGIGKIGEVIGQFLGISLLGGVVTLGMLLWKGVKGSGNMQQSM